MKVKEAPFGLLYVKKAGEHIIAVKYPKSLPSPDINAPKYCLVCVDGKHIWEHEEYECVSLECSRTLGGFYCGVKID